MANAFTGPRLSALLRRGGANVVLCSCIALMLAAMPGNRLGVSLVYSLAIGTLCWLAVDGGRLLVARWLGRRDPSGLASREGWPGWGWMSLVIVVGVGIAYPLGSGIAEVLVGQTPSRMAGGPEELQWRATAFVGLMSLVVTVVVTAFAFVRGKLAATAAEAEAARRAAAETQLKLLESQLEPHMLFNTLANLRVLIGLEPERAQRMLDHLIAFLRATLNASRTRLHPLSSEFDRIADYLALMTVRMGPRLAVRLQLPDDLRGAVVPPLLLQPLVENAIRHGLEPRVEGGTIDVVARRDGGTLVLDVRDTGVGLTAGPSAGGTSFGLQQVRDRLRTLHGSAARFTLEAAADDRGGVRARIELPLSFADEGRAP